MTNWNDGEEKINAELRVFWQEHRPIIIVAIAALALLLVLLKSCA